MQEFSRFGIPHPKPSLLSGNMGIFKGRDDAYRVHEDLKAKYGSYFGIYVGSERLLIITDLDMLKQVFIEKTKYFKERSIEHLKSPLTASILFAPHQRWRAMRKIMAPSFNRYTARGDNLTNFIEDAIKLALDYIDSRIVLDQTSRPVANIDMHNLMKATALYMISNMAVKLPGVKVCEDDAHVKALDAYLGMSSKGVILWAVKFPFLKRVFNVLSSRIEHKTLETIKHELNQEIDEQFKWMSKVGLSHAQRSNQHNHVIDILIRLHYEGKMSREEVLSNAYALLFAGYDTTSTTLAYILWALAKHPEIQDRLRADLMAHGIHSRYLDQVINETMRMYPTVMSFTSRVATETVTINNVIIPKDTKIIYSAWLIYRDPKVWTEPERFDPERFRDGHPEYHPCAFAPFGFAERRCLGYQLALLELKMFACDIVLRYKLYLKSPETLELVNYAFVLSKPKDKILIELERL